MWLLNVESLQLEFFEGEAVIDYAILSHTWDTEEVTFEDMKQLSTAQQKKGWTKIIFTCEQAKKDGLPYVWVDTCCINKDSSAELSESINSMFRWYHQADVCYVYLADVPAGLPERFHQLNTFRGSIGIAREGSTYVESKSNYANSQESWVEYVRRAIEESRWFTRGWTLQELIAPFNIKFYDQEWGLLGTKADLRSALSQITCIEERVLENMGILQSMSVAQRMSWAARRVTKRPEDEAYSLMGIFDINMPMLYGEGKKAFIRLQEEIIKKSTDHSIFAWMPWAPFSQSDLLLAPGPYGFRDAANVCNESTLAPPLIDESYVLTNNGLRITLPVLTPRNAKNSSTDYIYARLNAFEIMPNRVRSLYLRLWLSLNSRDLINEAASGELRQVLVCEVDGRQAGVRLDLPEGWHRPGVSSEKDLNTEYRTFMIRTKSLHGTTMGIDLKEWYSKWPSDY